MQPHKHAEIIKAWADGVTVQINHDGEWRDMERPLWTEVCEYRIKPAEKVVRWLWVYRSKTVPGWHLSGLVMSEEEMEARKDTAVVYKKLDFSRQEFDE